MACQADAVERQKQAAFWKTHTPESQPSVETMMLDSKAKDIDAAERPEILKLLGPVAGKRVVELGAGIGRFTGELAGPQGQAAHVVALDFMESSIAENRRLNGHMGNVEFRVGDVMDLDLEEGSCDVIFSNWLLMYLGNAEVQLLAARMLRWLAPGGILFFRESCFKQSGDKPREENPTHYRDPADYDRMFGEASITDEAAGTRSQFVQTMRQPVEAYIKLKGNPNQVAWKWVKTTEASQPGTPTSGGSSDSTTAHVSP